MSPAPSIRGWPSRPWASWWPGSWGVPLVLYGIRHGWVSCKEGSGLSRALLRGLRDPSDRPACAYSTTHPANIDSFGFHLGLMAGTYALAYLVGVVWTLYMPEKMKDFGFGMMFFWGMLIAMGMRKIMRWTAASTCWMTPPATASPTCWWTS